MGKQGKQISPSEHAKIMEMLEEGKNPRQMAEILKRSANCVYWHLKKHGIKLKQKGTYYPPKKIVLEEKVDYSLLDDSILFNDKMFPSF